MRNVVSSHAKCLRERQLTLDPALRQEPNGFNEHNMLTPIQCKMARAALAWTVKDLAEKAKIAANTVVRFENEKHEANVSTQTMI